MKIIFAIRVYAYACFHSIFHLIFDSSTANEIKIFHSNQKSRLSQTLTFDSHSNILFFWLSHIWTHWRWPGSVAVTWVHIICPHDLKSSFLDRSRRDLKNLLFVFIFSFFFTEKIGLKNYLNLIFLVYIQLKIDNFSSVQYNGRVGCSQASDANGRMVAGSNPGTSKEK